MKRVIWDLIYQGTLLFLYPLNYFLSKVRKKIFYENSVLHVSAMVHVPYYTVNILRKFGIKADYLAIGTSVVWNKSDFRSPISIWPPIQALKEVIFFWRVMAKYEIIHSHAMTTLSQIGWELPFLKKMGRKVVIHYRGCEIRDREKNMYLHPECNICQKCNYNPYPCEMKLFIKKRKLSKKYGDLFLVTTPDMKDFVLEAEYFPFFVPEINPKDLPERINSNNNGGVKIVHVTVHPGIEGTDEIERAINNLKNRGHKISFVFLSSVPHERVIEELRDADLSIGKMKMGYYANFQIESMVLGVPAITHIRPEFMTEDLRRSGFIITRLKDLEDTLQYYLTHPEELEKKRKVARNSILRLHNNELLGRRLIELYTKIKSP